MYGEVREKKYFECDLDLEFSNKQYSCVSCGAVYSKLEYELLVEESGSDYIEMMMKYCESRVFPKREFIPFFNEFYELEIEELEENGADYNEIMLKYYPVK